MEDVKRWLPVVGYAALIFYFSSRQGQELPRWELMTHDKILHAIEYAGLGLLLARALGAGRWWLAVVIAIAFGVSDEFHQSFVPHRNGNDLGDLTADLTGALLGAAAWVARTRLLRQPRADGTHRA